MTLYLIFKRIADLTFAVILLTVLSPINIFLTIALALANNGKPFFLQTRPGKGGKPFKIVKFKTMSDKKGANEELLPDRDRITKVGGLVRSTSLDEVPQFINVLLGQMSIVGPRPLLMQYLTLYDDFQKRRHEVKPGITGWAQVNGRNAINWNERFELNVWYVNNQSFRLDAKILLYTFQKVFNSEGISADGQATVEYFKGNKE